MISVNQRAIPIVSQMILDGQALGLDVTRLANGTTVIDAGINAKGSLEAGRLFSCACMGGLGRVRITQQPLPCGDGDSSLDMPAVAVFVENPHIACMASQYAGWAIRQGKFSAIGSGPARALYAGEEIYRKLDYRDSSDAAVLMMETRDLPDAAVASFVADKCGVSPEKLMLLVAPTASPTGSVQVAARSAETGLHKLVELGFDVRNVTAAFGLCPLAPVAADDLHAIGRTNDAILYGSRVYYSVCAEDADVAALIKNIPSSSSRDYGIPFYDLLLRHKGDFYKIDRLLFSPAEVTIHNQNSGRTFQAGHVDSALIRASFMEGGACPTR